MFAAVAPPQLCAVDAESPPSDRIGGGPSSSAMYGVGVRVVRVALPLPMPLPMPLPPSRGAAPRAAPLPQPARRREPNPRKLRRESVIDQATDDLADRRTKHRR